MHQNGRQKEFNSSYILNIFGALKTAQGTIWDTKTRNIQLCPQGTHKQQGDKIWESNYYTRQYENVRRKVQKKKKNSTTNKIQGLENIPSSVIPKPGHT